MVLPRECVFYLLVEVYSLVGRQGMEGRCIYLFFPHAFSVIVRAWNLVTNKGSCAAADGQVIVFTAIL